MHCKTHYFHVFPFDKRNFSVYLSYFFVHFLFKRNFSGYFSDLDLRLPDRPTESYDPDRRTSEAKRCKKTGLHLEPGPFVCIALSVNLSGNLVVGIFEDRRALGELVIHVFQELLHLLE